MGHDGRETLVIEGIELSTKPSEYIRRITKTRKNENTKKEERNKRGQPLMGSMLSRFIDLSSGQQIVCAGPKT